MKSESVPLTLCWHCDRALDAVSALGEDVRPDPGSVSLCMYCGAVAIFGEDMRLRPPTDKELDKMENDSEFRQQYVTFVWARQRVMIRHNLMRDRTDPDA